MAPTAGPRPRSRKVWSR